MMVGFYIASASAHPVSVDLQPIVFRRIRHTNILFYQFKECHKNPSVSGHKKSGRKGLAKPIGSITQLATMRMENNEEKLIKDVVPLTNLEDIVFGGLFLINRASVFTASTESPFRLY